MKKFLLLAAALFSAAICSNIYAQQAAPPGAGDKDLRDDNVRARSIDLERVDRDARKNNSRSNASTKAAEDKLAAKFGEIKTDYERIQMSEDAVIKAYKTGEKINYGQISKSAMEINSSAARLNSNLFPAAVEEHKEKKHQKDEKEPEKDAPPMKKLPELIVELDNVVGSFAASPMFQNLRTVDAAISEKARLDLQKIIELSAMLDMQAKILAANDK